MDAFFFLNCSNILILKKITHSRRPGSFKSNLIAYRKKKKPCNIIIVYYSTVIQISKRGCDLCVSSSDVTADQRSVSEPHHAMAVMATHLHALRFTAQQERDLLQYTCQKPTSIFRKQSGSPLTACVLFLAHARSHIRHLTLSNTPAREGTKNN